MQRVFLDKWYWSLREPKPFSSQTLLVLRILADDPPEVFSVVTSEHGVLEDDLAQGLFSTMRLLQEGA